MRNRIPIPLGEWREPHRYRPCTWRLCSDEATDRYPLPFCQRHILYVWSVVEQDMREAGMTPEKLAQRQAEEQEWRELERKADPRGMVYYLKVGEYIKIGFTKNLARRIQQYPPGTKLLGYRYGTRKDEQRTHQTFVAFLQSGREWYLDVPEIRQHIAEDCIPGGYLGPIEKRTRGDAPAPRLRTGTKRGARRLII